MRTTRTTAAVLLSLAACASADDGTNIIRADDKAALTAALGQKATVEGTVDRAEWSKNGKVMTVTFTGGPAFVLAAFQKSRDKLDAAFNGDLAKTLAGARIRVTGKPSKYGGHDEAYADATQMIVSMPTQLTILSAASRPTTAPTP